MRPRTDETLSIPAGAGRPGTDPWVLAYDHYDPDQEGLREALCALGNGLFVTRGAAEESRADGVHYPGTYVSGGYNQLASEIAGRTVVNEDLVNFPNWLCLTFRAEDGEWLRPGSAELLDYRQELHLKDGLLLRRFRVRDAHGRVTAVESRRFVSMRQPHRAAIEYRLRPENWDGDLWIRSELDATVINAGVERYRQLSSRHLEVLESGPVAPEGVYVVVQTVHSRFQVAEAARTRLYRSAEQLEPERRIIEDEPGRIGEELRVTVEAGQELCVEKVVTLYSSRDRGIGEPGLEARLTIGSAPSFEALLDAHRLAWEELWRRYDVEVGLPDSAAELGREQLILRLHIFHLLQTVSPHTVGLDAGAPARGLHGEAYRGHIFWDELFVFPFYSLRMPVITRSLLLYRFRRLDAARELAREAGHAGAIFPWQSSSDGREATQELHLNPLSGRWDPDWSRLQRHVNAAIVYNIWRYWSATGDRSFLRDYGAEIVLEIARAWSSLSHWNEERERYEIHGVVGPDEYHEKYPDTETGGLRNNAYTNVMAVWCLLRALDVLEAVGVSYREELLARLGFGEDELERWEHITRHMFVPFHDGVISQFEGYEALEELDWEAYRAKYGDIGRMDRILKAENDSPDRYKVSKQADVNMLFYLLEREELCELFDRLGYELNDDIIRRTIEYYMERTSHGSTLSRMVFASVIHHLDSATGFELFLDALRSDIDDIQGGTTPEGIHLGAMAGTVAMALHRYAGADATPECVAFEPDIPDHLARLRFRMQWHDRWLDVDLSEHCFCIRADQDLPDDVPVRVRDEVYDVEPGVMLEVHEQ